MEQLGTITWAEHVHCAFTIGQQYLAGSEGGGAWRPAWSPAAFVWCEAESHTCIHTSKKVGPYSVITSNM